MSDKDRYFNFPICLIDGIFEDKMKVLNNIFDYSIYAHALNLENETVLGSMKSALKYFGVTAGNISGSLKNGQRLFSSIPEKNQRIKTGIKKDLFFEFYQNDKTEFEIAVLCGYCAIRSILLFKSYCKVTKDYMLVRMAGRSRAIEITNLPEPLKRYTKRYHLEKVKKELALHWHLKMYGLHTRGFYVSFDLPLTDLVYQVEKKRKKFIEKNYKQEQVEARKEALKRLYEPTQHHNSKHS